MILDFGECLSRLKHCFLLYFKGQVEAVDKDIIGSSNIRYSLKNSTYFSIDSVSGNITALKVFDREQINHYNLTVIAIDGGGRKGIGDIVVYIIDVNDCAPRFEKSFYNISIHENFPVEEIVAYITAVDLDDTENAQIIYSANFTSRQFVIQSSTGGIILKKSLRLNHHYVFTVHAKDHGGLQGPHSVTTVQFNVLPASSKPPYFIKSKYRFKIKENNNIGKMIGQVLAARQDSGSTMFLSYSIISGNKEKIFRVNSIGVITTSITIDYETYKEFKLVVRVSDLLNKSLKSNATVFISIIDQNDNEPRFIIKTRNIDIAEGVPIGYTIYNCKTIDLDSGRNGLIKYHLLNTTGPFNITQHSGKVYTTGPLDYESVKFHRIYLGASDGGSPMLSSHLILQVVVMDMNDNPPLFINTSYLTHTKESVKVGSNIIKLYAHDVDSGKNGEFFFGLVPNKDSKSFPYE